MLKKPDKLADPNLLFGAIPLRVRSDPRLTPLDFRVLIAIACRDRMSEIAGGAGCFAKRETLAGEVGCHPNRLSNSIGRLIDFGYLQRRKVESDQRRHMLTVRYQHKKVGSQGGYLFGEIGNQNQKIGNHANSQASDAKRKSALEDNPYKIKKDSPSSSDDGFRKFWESYPRKVAKKAAEKAFARAIKEAPLEQMLAALAIDKQDWKEERFTPHPATWLNGGRYLDHQDKLNPLKTYRPPGHEDD